MGNNKIMTIIPLINAICIGLYSGPINFAIALIKVTLITAIIIAQIAIKLFEKLIFKILVLNL